MNRDGGRSSFGQILVVDDCPSFLRYSTRQLTRAGFDQVFTCSTINEAREQLIPQSPVLLLVDIYLGAENGLQLVGDLRSSGYRGLIMVISADFSLEAIEMAAWFGANDFYIKNSEVTLANAVKYLLERQPRPRQLGPKEEMNYSGICSSTFIRCIGLSPFEKTLLEAFCRKTSSQKNLAYQLGRSDSYIRKTLSGIYRKFQVDNQTELAKLLMCCSRFVNI